jgi:GTP-binding protein
VPSFPPRAPAFTVAIVGRPNVGKSTLFNRLAGRRLAIVDDTPGVTRDRREGEGRLGDLRFTAIDTAGFDDAGGDALEARMLRQTEQALGQADVAVLLIDARAGVTPLDTEFAERLRRHPTPVILAANKCEGRAGEAGKLEAYALGLGDPVALSAEHGEGMGELYDALAEYVKPEEGIGDDVASDLEVETDPDGEDDGLLQLAVVGRPNVGKSTLINRLVGEDRLVTGPEAGITRDAISISWTFQGRMLRLIDTAGLRRKSKVTGKLEGLSSTDTLRAIKYAQVVVLVIDGTLGLEKQDLTIARNVVDEGRALVLAINKWDIVNDRRKCLGEINDRLETSLPQVKGIRMVACSALTGKGLDRLLPTVLGVYDTWNRRVPTGPLNRWLQDMTDSHPPPLARGRRLRLRYMTQAKTRPPTFVVFASRPEELPEAYVRYLVNGLRTEFNLEGVPLRLFTRKGKNPYAR